MIVSISWYFQNVLNLMFPVAKLLICVAAWNTVSRELDMCHNQPHSNSSNYRNGASVTYYQEREPNPQLKGNFPNF